MWADPRGGYAILLLLVLGVLGATLAPGGLRNRRRAPQRIVAAALLVGAALSLLWPGFRARALARTNSVSEAISPVGTWVYATDTLLIDANGSYACRGLACTGMGLRGSWRMAANDGLVVRWTDGHEVPWKIVRYNGRDRLGLSPAPGASWEATLSFTRVSP